MPPRDPLRDALSLVTREPERADERADVAGRLDRLCRAAKRELSASAVGMTVMSSTGAPMTVAASGPADRELEELQFVVGEGPCLDAYRTGGPVLVADLTTAFDSPWPGYAAAALDRGVRAVFAFPLQIGAARLGALDVYRDRVGPLARAGLGMALDFAELALHWLLDSQFASADALPLIDDAADNRIELYQAQGMVSIQLGVDMPTAMARLRAHAYAHGLGLSQVARDVVARRLAFEVDDG